MTFCSKLLAHKKTIQNKKVNKVSSVPPVLLALAGQQKVKEFNYVPLWLSPGQLLLFPSGLYRRDNKENAGIQRG